jgi:hypothetical protein
MAGTRRASAVFASHGPDVHVFGLTSVAVLSSLSTRHRSMNVKVRRIEIDEATAEALEARAAEAGLSVRELLAEMVTVNSASQLSSAELVELDREWDAIKAGEPTIAHDDVVRWLDTWGTSGFRPWKGR